MSIRSFLIGSISKSKSIASNVLESEDVLSTISCLRKLGTKIKKLNNRTYIIHGKGLGSLFIKKKVRDSRTESCEIETLLWINGTGPDHP